MAADVLRARVRLLLEPEFDVPKAAVCHMLQPDNATYQPMGLAYGRLKLPDGILIVWAEWDPWRNSLEVLVEGPGLAGYHVKPIVRGNEPPRIHVTRPGWLR